MSVPSSVAALIPGRTLRRHFRRLLPFIGCVALGLLTSAAAGAQNCDRYLNATDGDDENFGASPSEAVRSFEHAFLEFPSESVVCMTAGEYFHGSDADGVQLTGAAARDKSMTFVLQNFAGSDQVSFTEDEFRIDLGSGRVRFLPGSASELLFGVGVVNAPQNFPNNTNLLHTLALMSGTLEAESVVFRLGPPVGNPSFYLDGLGAPADAAVIRGAGALIAATPYETEYLVARDVVYVQGGDRTVGPELPPRIRLLRFEHDAGTVTVGRAMTFAAEGRIEHAGAGTARIRAPISISGLRETAVHVSGSGDLHFEGPVVLSPRLSEIDLLRISSDGELDADSIHVAGSNASSAALVNASSGRLTLGVLETGISVVIRNEGSGSVVLGDADGRSRIEADLVNAPSGTLRFLGTAWLTGDVVNEGTMLVGAPLSLTGRLHNAGTVSLEADLELTGGLVNSGTAALGDRTLVLSGPEEHTNDGSITSSEIGIGWLELHGDLKLSGSGRVSNVRGRDGEQRLGLELLRGAIEAGGGAVLTISTADTILGFAAANGGELVLPAVVVARDLVASKGVLRLTGSAEILGSVRQSAESTLEARGHRIRVHGDFRRDGGAFLGGEAALEFAGDDTSNLRPGPDLAVRELDVPTGRVDLSGNGLTVLRRLTVGSAAALNLDDVTLSLAGADAEALVNGRVEAGPKGSLVFGRADQKMSGGGYLASVGVDLPDENGTVVVTGSADIHVGALSLMRGTLRIAAGGSVTLAGREDAPQLRRNLGDANLDGRPDGRVVIANEPGQGTFVIPDGGYHLEYLSATDATAETGVEAQSGPIVDFRLTSSGASGGARFALSSNLTFAGSIDVDPNVELHLGDHLLEAAGSGAMHSVRGSVRANTGSFVISGQSVLAGSPAEGPSTIQNLTSRTDLEVRNVARIGGRFRIESGTAVIELGTGEGSATDSAGHVDAVHLFAPGRLVLGGGVRVAESIALEGELVFGNHDLIMAPGAAFTATASSRMPGDGSGRLVFVGDGWIRTEKALVPRLQIDAGPDGRVRLTGDAGVSRAFVHTSGTLDLQEFRFVNGGRLWSHTQGSYTGTGTMVIRGNVAGEFHDDVHVPNLEMAGASDQTVFTIGPESGQPRSLVIDDELRLTHGMIDLGRHDLVVRGLFAAEKGRLSAVRGNDIADESSGELVLAGADVLLAAEQLIPNLRVREDSRVLQESGRVVIGAQIAFEKGSLLGTDRAHVHVSDGARIGRTGRGTFDGAPSFAKDIDLDYDAAGASEPRLVSGREVPETGVRNLVVSAGGGVVELTSAMQVGALLELRSGVLISGAPLEVARGGVVHIWFGGQAPPRFVTTSYTAAGPIDLVYTGLTGDLRSDDLSFPADAQIATLTVRMGDGANQRDREFLLHADRSIRRLIIESGTPASGMRLDGSTLHVAANVELRRGVLAGSSEAALNVGGDLTTRPSTLIHGALMATVRGRATIGGTLGTHLLRSAGDVTVSGRLGGPDVEPDAGAGVVHEHLPNLELIGNNQTIRFTTADDDPTTIDDAVNQLILRLADTTGTVSIQSRGETPHTLGVNRLILESGLLLTGRGDIRLPPNGIGFVRADDAMSHVVGRVSRRVQTGQPNPFTLPFGRFEFPVGAPRGSAAYRPLVIRFTEDNPITTTSILTVRHEDSPAGGYLGLPIEAGVGIRLQDTGGFHWSVESSPPLRAAQRLNLGFAAAEWEPRASIDRLRIVHRSAGAPSDEAWELFGDADRYRNAIVTLAGRAVPYIEAVQATAGAGAGRFLVAAGIEHADMNYSRFQVINVLEEGVDVLIDDTVRATDLEYGGASSYLRVSGTRRKLTVSLDDAVVVGDSIELVPGTDYVAVAVHGEGQARLHVAENARAVPDADERHRASLAFFNVSTVGSPLSLRASGSARVLFEEVPIATFSESYVPLDPMESDFELLSRGHPIDASGVRANLQMAAGMTATAVAAIPLRGSQASSGATPLFFVTNHGDRISTSVDVAIEQPVAPPEGFSVDGNYPNPFNPTTTIVLDLPEPADVTVDVFDLLGRHVLSFGPVAVAAGARRRVELDGRSLASGAYVYRVTAASPSYTRRGSGKMIVVR